MSRFNYQLAQKASKAVFRSAQQAKLFREQAPNLLNKVIHIDDGIDVDYFNPALSYPNPYGKNSSVIVYSGKMDDPANVEAVRWFANKVWPHILTIEPSAQFHIVGSQPTSEVIALSRYAGIFVIGQVADVRPYLSHAKLAVAPLRLLLESFNSIFEIFAMQKPLVTTRAVMEGIEHAPAECFNIAQDIQDWINLCRKYLHHDEDKQCSDLRRYVLNQHAWDARLRRYLELFNKAG